MTASSSSTNPVSLSESVFALDARGGMYEVNLDGLEDMVFLRGVETVLGEDRSLVPKTLDKALSLFGAAGDCRSDEVDIEEGADNLRARR